MDTFPLNLDQLYKSSGEILPCQIYETFVSKDILYKTALARDIPLSTPAEQLCQEILAQIPSNEWLKNNLMQRANRLTPNENTLINQYAVFAFSEMNAALRSQFPPQAIINELIEKMDPLDHNIIVYRYFNVDEWAPNIGVYQSKGYLSTTMTPLLTTTAGCGGSQYKNVGVMKIYVPKGKKCLYIKQGSIVVEQELLFAHNILLQVTTIKPEIFLCLNEDESLFANTINVYNIVML